MSASLPITLLANLPGIVASAIHDRLPDLAECTPMLGGFDLEELKRTSVKAPAIRVTRLGLRPRDTRAGPHRRFDAMMAAFVITRDRAGLPRDVALSNLTAALLALIPDNSWATAGLGEAEGVEERVLVNGATRGVALSLAAVTWVQPVTLAALPASGPVPVTLYLGGIFSDEVLS
ncbi:MAG: hypothetical protein IKG52_11155 [Rhodobacteraceae bacterium]|nr:hypothetical protein [Paracoccaceae bacterium]